MRLCVQGQTDFFIGADLPGVGYSLNFFRWEGDQSITHVPTAGRVVDHVGFEVKNLDAFCKALEAKGIRAWTRSTDFTSECTPPSDMAQEFTSNPH